MADPSHMSEAQTRELYRIATAKADNNVKPSRIERALMAKGADPETAATVVRAVLELRSPQGRRSSGWTKVIVGGAAVLFGAIATMSSFVSAGDRGGGWYVIWFGPVVFGAISIWRGLDDLDSARK